jgi:hypothetical protein
MTHRNKNSIQILIKDALIICRVYKLNRSELETREKNVLKNVRNGDPREIVSEDLSS